MFKKILNSLTGSKPKEQEVEEVQTPEVSFEKYIKVFGEGISITDRDKELEELPDDFFDSYLDISFVEIYANALKKLPSSIGRLQRLERVQLYDTRIAELPESFEKLPALRSFTNRKNNLFKLEKNLPILAKIEGFEKLELGGFKGKIVPASLKELKDLRVISITSEVEKRIDLPAFFTLIAEMTWLKKVKLFYLKDGVEYKSYLAKLDFLELLDLSSSATYTPTTAPLEFGLLEHVSFGKHSNLGKVLEEFREKVAGKEITEEQRKILFGFFVGNFLALKEEVPNLLMGAFEKKEKINLFLDAKPKGLTKKALKEKLVDSPIVLDGKDKDAAELYVVGVKSAYEKVEELVTSGKKLILTDHLQELVVKLDDPWLLQEENSELNEQLLQLLSSHIDDNYLVAFQIIEGGGADRMIQSMLAAIMLAHTDKAIAKKAEKLYTQYGSTTFVAHCKTFRGLSLRRSKDTLRKLNHLLSHPDIDALAFRLMHHRIASENPNISDVYVGELIFKEDEISTFGEEFQYFSHIHTLVLEKCPNLNLAQILPVLAKLPSLKNLTIKSCHVQVPASIGTLSQVEKLELSFSTVIDPSCLGSLSQLTSLNLEGCKVEEWKWIENLTKLNELNCSNNGLKAFPEEFFGLKLMRKMEAKQNKLTEIDQRITSWMMLGHLDLCNNQLKELPSFVFQLFALEVLLLRSNKIKQFDSKEYVKKLDGKVFPIKSLNLARNGLTEFSFGSMPMQYLQKLDISNNKLSVLDASVFTNTGRLIEFYASSNQFTEIPKEITNNGYFQKLWLHKNELKKLPSYMADIRVDNCDVSNNQIEFIHPDFDVKGKDRYARLYWKLRNNPVCSTFEYGWGGLSPR
ncbi:hypothetical protein R9C00_01005 [Flammeovirgaceae bacterium SG7u.111]|nr:hypothetical protein [Flammeovirgaceae bacterium SG7u.132]WPO36026.1 hypothetical protein R9C00_01005 [Flammeovirgaceae bacterium SG7u.111]